jgi:16S rRNA processing protein RimM
MIVMGHVSAPFGVRGWVKVRTYTETPDSLLDFPVWWLGKGQDWREYRVLEANVHGSDVVARLEGSDDRNFAETLQGHEVAVPREQLPETGSDEFYWSDLIGLRVENAQGVVLGVVDSLMETGANDVLVVKGERQRLIPFVRSVVLSVNLGDRLISVDWDAEF